MRNIEESIGLTLRLVKKIRKKTRRKMETNIKDILIQQLEKKGIQPNQIPGFIRDMENTFLDDPFVSLFQANSHLQSLGWDDIQLDYPTFLLAQEYLRDEGES